MSNRAPARTEDKWLWDCSQSLGQESYVALLDYLETEKGNTMQTETTFDIKIDFKPFTDVLANWLFTCASNYWGTFATVSGQGFDEELTAISEGRLPTATYPDGHGIVCFDVEDPEEKLGTVTFESLHKGAQVLASKHPRHFCDILSGNDDATTADVLVQCAAIGEITFG